MKKLFAVALLLSLPVMAQSHERVAFGVTSGLHVFPVGVALIGGGVWPVVPYVLPHLEYLRTNDRGELNDFARFSVIPIPVQTFGHAEYRRYFAPLAAESGAAEPYWNVGALLLSNPYGDSGMRLNVHLGVGYEWVLDGRWSLSLEGNLEPFVLAQAMSDSRYALGYFVAFGLRTSATYRFW